jgi:C1A family cysteine protease
MDLKNFLSNTGIFRLSKLLRSSAVWRKGALLLLAIFTVLSLTGCALYISTHVIFHPGQEWKAETHLSLTPQQLMLLGGQETIELKLQDEAARLRSRNIDCTWQKESQKDGVVSYIISAEGKGIEQFKQAIFGKSYIVELLAGPISLRVSGNISQGKTLDIELDSNPSTGYRWEVGGIDKGMLHQLGGIEFRQVSKLLGAVEKQILHFEAVDTGKTTLELTYRRPWEKDAKPTREVYIETEGINLTDLFSHSNNPTSTTSTCHTCSGEKRESEKVAISPPERQHLVTSPKLSLPSAFNWCEHRGCTPIKDQGGCGSCWAFATVGPLESAIKIRDGIEVDLSEQYLVSCNTEGWGCNGGWWAHDYHWNKIPPSESEAGAVLEADFPYEGEDVSCNGPYPHPYKLNSWGCVGDTDPPSCCTGNILPTDDLKQAIYRYGPISAGVYVGPAFQEYSGGVFETNETGDINHGVTLVGWDDTQGTNGVWILRNSWGPNWGENSQGTMEGERGYMRIGYGISNVGSCASYIVYNLTTTATRDIAQQALAPGGTTQVMVTIDVAKAEALSLDENPPAGWTLTRVSESPRADAYKASTNEWVWFQATVGTITVVYDLTAPADATGSYTLAGTISGVDWSKAVGGETEISAAVDILAYYRAYSGDPTKVETADLLKAANDWAGEVVPPGFTEPISTTQLLTLANEWAATE